MRSWLIGLALLLVALGGFGWWAAFDADAPGEAEAAFDLEAYRALVAEDREALPSDVRVEFVGMNYNPSFAAEAGLFEGDLAFTYPAFQVVSASGDVVIDAAIDEATLEARSRGAWRFDADAQGRLFEAMTRATHILVTHEHSDHVMAIVDHPDPASIRLQLALTRAQLDGLPAAAGMMPEALNNLSAEDVSTPRRIAPGIVAHAAPGHSPGSIVVYVRTTAREYLFIGDIAWLMSNIEELRGRPRFIRWVIPAVDPDRNAVLHQLRALHDLAATEPDLIIAPSHDEVYLRQLVADGALTQGFAIATQPDVPQP